MNKEEFKEQKESSMINCKHCGKLKIRFLDGKHPKGEKRWVDAKGFLFMGHTCPDCHREKVALRKRLKAKNRKLEDSYKE